MRKYLLAIAVVLACVSNVSAKQVDYSNRDLDCMARNIYFEARGESDRGMIMVAEVTLNRLDHKKFPQTICGVIYQKGAFQWTTGKGRISDKEEYERAKSIAKSVLDGSAHLTGTEALFFKRKGSKSSFHDSRIYLGTTGNHSFYK